MAAIFDVFARMILDSRGNPTVEVEVTTEDGVVGRAAVPSGASTGEHEAVELRDGDKARWRGKGVDQAIGNVNDQIAHQLIGLDARDQRAVDRLLIELDGSPNKARLGANALLACSMAVARAASIAEDLPLYRHLGGVGPCVLPVPLMNVVNGGAHADNNVDIQEFMVCPIGAATFADALRMGVEIYHVLKGVISARGLSTNVGDEGGFAPNLESNEAALQLLVEATKSAGFTPGTDVVFAIDAAASEFSKQGVYTVDKEPKDAAQMVEYYTRLVERYPLVSIEDGLAEDDWAGWKLLNQKLGKTIQLVGDDLLRHERRAAPSRARGGRRERDPREAQPDRDGVRDARRGGARADERLARGHLAPVRRDRGHVHRGPRGGDTCRPDQDGRAGAHRSRGEVQPAPPDRGRAGGHGGLRWPGRDPRALVELFDQHVLVLELIAALSDRIDGRRRNLVAGRSRETLDRNLREVDELFRRALRPNEHVDVAALGVTFGEEREDVVGGRPRSGLLDAEVVRRPLKAYALVVARHGEHVDGHGGRTESRGGSSVHPLEGDRTREDGSDGNHREQQRAKRPMRTALGFEEVRHGASQKVAGPYHRRRAMPGGS